MTVFSCFKTKYAISFILLLVTASLLLSLGCAPARKRAPTLDRAQNIQTQKPIAAPAPEEPADPVSVIDSFEYADTLAAGEDSGYQDPGQLIETAKSLCDSGNFAAADSILKEAVKAVETSEEAPDSASEWFPSSQSIDDIVALYNQKMPAAYPVPEELTLGVFQRQMMRSIDSMNVLPSDSISLAAIACQKNIAYDVPMVWNQRVQRALYYYVRNRQNTVDHWFYRASYYLPVMKAMFADSGLPKDLAYLPLIESGFNPLAYSYANASGIWQFIASTGKVYGLKRSFWLDERRDPIRSTKAAIGYLKKLYGDFGHWHLALAAYNCGENGVARNIVRHNTSDFWSLKKLPKQTKNYVPCYLAALTIAKNPKCFGVIMPPTGTLPLDTVHLSDCISLGDIAAGLNVEYDTLRKMNPHIMRWCTPPDVTNTLLYLPAGAKKGWSGFLAQLPPEKRVKWYRYQIKRNDTIESLSRQYNVPVNALISINRLTAAKLTQGHHLFIPVSDTVLGQDVAYTMPPESEIKALDLPDYEFAGIVVRHRIRPGDNLGKIGRRYHVSVKQLCRWNRITGRTILRPGRLLVVSRPRPPLEASPKPFVVSKPAPVVVSGAAADTMAKPAVAQATSQQVTAAESSISQAAVPSPVAQPIQQKVHVVKIGETLFSISRKYNLTVRDLAFLNGLNVAHPRIKIGQSLVISHYIPAPLARIDTAYEQRQLTGANAPAPAQKNGNEWNVDTTSAAPAIVAPVQMQEKLYHIVVKGENLFRISQKYSLSTPAIMSANRISDESLIRAGDTLLIPPGPVTVPAPENTPAPSDVIYYKVREGDTLLRIAAAFGIPVDSLYKENNLNPDSVLSPGKVIRVVGK